MDATGVAWIESLFLLITKIQAVAMQVGNGRYRRRESR